MGTSIRHAQWPDDSPAVAGLFRAYAASLDFSLDFQDFDAELANLPGDYAAPDGALLLAIQGSSPVGCVALRPLVTAPSAMRPACEMKRLYVKPDSRAAGAGRMLCEHLIGFARAAHYRAMLLDTVSSMHAAIALYRSLGFQATRAYCHNPQPDARYFVLNLVGDSPAPS